MCLGIPGKIISVKDEQQALVVIDVGGVQRDVNVTCVREENQPLSELVGEWVLVHVGFAMSIINEQEARLTMKILSDSGDLAEEHKQILYSAK